jgi:poly-gamma-glutamate capsule biosynthesis protein CapA/YwtB (metallophosphatase superfamily)
MTATTKLFLCGDVMTGRGVDQILPHSCQPRLQEPVARSAVEYVALAERAHGPIPRRVDYAYVWGDALAICDEERPDARIVNLETAVTTSDDAEPKGINYRMHPGNVPLLSAAGIDCCTLANNHVLDWGEAGLLETLDVLERAGIRTAGAGRDGESAEAPAIVTVADRTRVIVFAFGARDSGVRGAWRARSDRPGVNVLADFSSPAVEHLADAVSAVAKDQDIVVASIHWGPNWGYEIPDAHRRFAHDVIDHARVDVVWGHSSHHPMAIEIHAGRPILYGCGDLLNDYEGIPGHEEFRPDLALMYFLSFGITSGRLVELAMRPLQIRNFRLGRVAPDDGEWLRQLMDRECARFGHRTRRRGEGFELDWTGPVTPVAAMP